MNEYEMQINMYYNLLNVPDIEAVDYEVPMAGHYADIVYIENNDVHALELKLTWCNRGLEQAQFYLSSGANYASVITRKQRIPKKHLIDFNSHGVGLGFYLAPNIKEVMIDYIRHNKILGFHFPIEWVVKPTRVPDDELWTRRARNCVRFKHGENVKIWRMACMKGEN